MAQCYNVQFHYGLVHHEQLTTHQNHVLCIFTIERVQRKWPVTADTHIKTHHRHLCTNWQ